MVCTHNDVTWFDNGWRDPICNDCGVTPEGMVSITFGGHGPLEFTVQVEATDRTVVDGAFVVVKRTVQVRADDEVEAELVACQMVGCTIPQDFMVTASRITAVIA